MFTVSNPRGRSGVVGGHFNLDTIPDECPICHQGVEPIVPEWNYISRDSSTLEKVYICPHRSCGHLFVARYARNGHSGHYFLRQCVPTELQNYAFAEELQKISPDFCAIYNEAQKVEEMGFLLISGPGYRKSLEFLIKDYLTSLQTDDAAKKGNCGYAPDGRD